MNDENTIHRIQGPARSLSVSQLKARLSEYMAKVRLGWTVVITDRGKPIARLEPLTFADAPDRDAAELVARGLARLPTGKLDDTFFARPFVEDPEGAVLKALLEERDEDER